MRIVLMIAALATTAALAACESPAYDLAGRTENAGIAHDGTAQVPAPRQPWDYPDFALNRS